MVNIRAPVCNNHNNYIVAKEDGGREKGDENLRLNQIVPNDIDDIWN